MTLVTAGVDTHRDTHVPAALDERGDEPGIESFPATAARYSKLLSWLNSFGTVKRVGVQDTACYSAGLSRHLQPKGIEVIEVDRPNRHLRRRAGKSDPVDATGAASAAQSSQTTAIAKTVDGDLEISVNVWARQLVSAGLAKTVTEVADRTGVAPDQLCLEVTETALVDQPEIAIANLASLLDLGIDIALDGFRTGHASLTYLPTLPITHIKIDRSFTAGLGSNAGDTTITKFALALAHRLGLQAIAEGIETQTQLDLLKHMNCDLGQGYHLIELLFVGI